MFLGYKHQRPGRCRLVMIQKIRMVCGLAGLQVFSCYGDSETRDPLEIKDPMPAIDKSGYTFFKPTPNWAMREMSLDGPGATESPFTVDAGHFQIEMSLFDYTSERDTFEGVDYRLDFVAAL